MRTNRRVVVAPVLALAALLGGTGIGEAQATISIKKADGTTVPNGSATIAYNPQINEYEIHLLQLYNPNHDTVFEIHGNAGEIINLLSIDVNGPAAGSPLMVRVLSDSPGGVNIVRGIIQTGSAETTLTKIQVNLDIGWIEVESIGDLIAGRDVLGPINATTSDNPIRGVSTITATRHILGDVHADNGRILLVNAVNGNIGTAAQPVDIRAKHSVYHVMGHDVYANVNCRYNGGDGGSWALVADRYFGTLECQSLIFNQYNSLDARYAITQQFAGRIIIGRSYNSAAQYIELPPLSLGGCAGQIIINADNVLNGTWSAPIRLGPAGAPASITLNGPRYSLTSAQIGGGSIGLVPFRLHDQSCSPVNGSTVQMLPNSTPLTVQLRHFGPIRWDATSGAPVTIERRQAGTQNSYVMVPTTDFTYVPGSNDPNLLLVGPAPGHAGFAPGYDYRIKPATQLKCDVAASPLPLVKWDTDYLITVTNPACPGDVDGNGLVNINDLVMIITMWGPVNPAFPAADLTHDSFVNIDDLVVVITHWGQCW